MELMQRREGEWEAERSRLRGDVASERERAEDASKRSAALERSLRDTEAQLEQAKLAAAASGDVSGTVGSSSSSDVLAAI